MRAITCSKYGLKSCVIRLITQFDTRHLLIGLKINGSEKTRLNSVSQRFSIAAHRLVVDRIRKKAEGDYPLLTINDLLATGRGIVVRICQNDQSEEVRISIQTAL